MPKDLSALNAFRTTCERNLALSQSFESVVACKAAFDDLLRSYDLVRFVNSELERMLENNDYYPQISAERSVTVLDRPEYKLFLTCLPRVTVEDSGRARIISGLTGHHVIGCVQGGPVRIMRCRRPTPHPHNVFSRAATLSRLSDTDICLGESLAFDGNADLFSVIESSETLLMRLSTQEIGYLRWDYDIETLEPIRAVAASLRDSRTEFAAEVLGLIGDAESAEVLEGLYEHPAHFVRWKALQALALLDTARALPLIHKAALDEHPHVRNAAQATLREYNGVNIV